MRLTKKRQKYAKELKYEKGPELLQSLTYLERAKFQAGSPPNRTFF